MDDGAIELVFAHIQIGITGLVRELLPIPIEQLKLWLEITTKPEFAPKTPAGMQMLEFHTAVIQAYIKAREYAIADHSNKIKNN